VLYTFTWCNSHWRRRRIDRNISEIQGFKCKTCVLKYHGFYWILYYIILYHISYHIISYHITSHSIISYRIVSYRSIYHITSHHIISYHITSHIISYIISCIISYIISCHILYYIILYFIISYIMSYIVLYLISYISCHVIYCIMLYYIHLIVCLMTGPKPLPKRVLHIVWSRLSSFIRENPLLSLRSSSSFLRLLLRLPVTSIPFYLFFNNPL
jgi:hypothetical protein